VDLALGMTWGLPHLLFKWPLRQSSGSLPCVKEFFLSSSIVWSLTQPYSTGLPGVIPDFPDEPPVGLTDGVYWTPQVIGGVGFVIASLLLMREEQRSWWQISPIRIGW
jgi:hypothetical protein